MTVYTKTGDDGTTGLYSADQNKEIRCPKDSRKVQAIGAIDELNSYLGVAKSFSKDKNVNKLIFETQNNLFTISSILAGANLPFSEEKIFNLEKQIDEWEGTLPVLKNFVISGGSQVGSLVFYARTLARRAERRIVSLKRREAVKEEIVKYMNRISDYLFMLARFINISSGVEEQYWQGSKN